MRCLRNAANSSNEVYVSLDYYTVNISLMHTYSNITHFRVKCFWRSALTLYGATVLCE